MRPHTFAFVVFASAFGCILTGCGSPGVVRHMEFDDTTGNMILAEQATTGRIAIRMERFVDGGLSAEEWEMGDYRVRLSFYPSDRLKSEERFARGEVKFGRYYTDSGALEREVGKLPRNPAGRLRPVA
jgi:hypothetical protein